MCITFMTITNVINFPGDKFSCELNFADFCANPRKLDIKFNLKIRYLNTT